MLLRLCVNVASNVFFSNLINDENLAKLVTCFSSMVINKAASPQVITVNYMIHSNLTLVS